MRKYLASLVLGLAVATALPLGLETKIIGLRRDHPRLGKKKIAVLCGVSESKAGRILGDIKKRGLLPKYATVRVDARTGRLHEKHRTSQPRIRRPKQKKGLEIDTVVPPGSEVRVQVGSAEFGPVGTNPRGQATVQLKVV